MGLSPVISDKRGFIVVNIGLTAGAEKTWTKKRSSYNEIILHILRDGEMTTPEIHEEINMLGSKLSMESLLKILKNVEREGLVKSSKVARGGGQGRGVNTWQLKSQ